jgi:hypothetical protein
MSLFNKVEKKQLRQFAGIAYERELEIELSSLNDRFSAWQRGDIDAFQLSDDIHEFHQGPSRELYNFYTGVDPHMAVARAVVEELLSHREVPDELMHKLVSAIDFYRGQREREQSDANHGSKED